MKNIPMEYKGYYASVTCDMKSKKLRGVLRAMKSEKRPAGSGMKLIGLE